MATWTLVGVSNAAVNASGNYTLTEPAGCAQNDILVVDIVTRSTVIFTNAAWTFPQSDAGGNTTNAATTSDTSFITGYCIRGASAPSLVFARTGGSRALGTIRAYRSSDAGTPTFHTSAKVAQTTASTTITLTSGITTTDVDQLLVTGVFLARASATTAQASAMDAVTGATTGSGSLDTTTAPTANTWIERVDRGDTTSPTVALACYDAVKSSAGTTGNLTCVAANSALNGMTIMAFKHPLPATRYWRGGTNTWNSTAGSKWSATSGGATGAPAPVITDDVFFDATSSGTVTVVTSDVIEIKSIDFTGFTGTLTGGASTTIYVHRNMTFASGMTLTATNSWSALTDTGVTAAITTNGKTLGAFAANGTGTGDVVLMDDLTVSGQVNAVSGVFHANGMNITAPVIGINGGTVHMGSGVWTVSGTVTPWTAPGGTINPDTSTIRFSNNSTSSKTFSGNDRTYYNFENATGGTGPLSFTGSNTFNSVDIATVNSSRTVRFTAGTTTTVSELKKSTGTGHILTSPTSAQHTLVDTSGTNTLNDTTISWSNATGGATWSYGNGVDGGNNTGWTFPTLALSGWDDATFATSGGSATYSNSNRTFAVTAGGGQTKNYPVRTTLFRDKLTVEVVGNLYNVYGGLDIANAASTKGFQVYYSGFDGWHITKRSTAGDVGTPNLSPAPSGSDVVSVDIDWDAMTIQLRVNNTVVTGVGGAFTSTDRGIDLVVTAIADGSSITSNFEAADLAYTPPSGYLAWLPWQQLPTPSVPTTFDAGSKADFSGVAVLSNGDLTMINAAGYSYCPLTNIPSGLVTFEVTTSPYYGASFVTQLYGGPIDGFKIKCDDVGTGQWSFYTTASSTDTLVATGYSPAITDPTCVLTLDLNVTANLVSARVNGEPIFVSVSVGTDGAGSGWKYWGIAGSAAFYGIDVPVSVRFRDLIYPPLTGYTEWDAAFTTITTTLFPVTAGADDGEEYLSSLNTGGSSFFQGNDAGNPYQMVARFLNVTVPQGSVLDANLILESFGSSGANYGGLVGDDVDNSPALSGSHKPSTMTPTTTSKSLNGLALGFGRRRIDVKYIVREIIGRSGWASGNAVTIFGDATAGTGAFVEFGAYEGGTPPKLETRTSTGIIWNPFDRTSSIILTNGNLTAEIAISSGGVRSTKAITAKVYAEFTRTGGSGGQYFGVAGSSHSLVIPPGNINGVGVGEGGYGIGDTNYTILANNVSSEVLAFAYDPTTNEMWVKHDNSTNWNNNSSANPATGVGGFLGLPITGDKFFQIYIYDGTVTANFGAAAFHFTPPSGFVGLDTPSGPANYPMAADTGTVTLTGNSAALRVGRKLTAVKGTITLTGNAAGRRISMAAVKGTIALTGVTTGLRTTRGMTAAPVTITQTRFPAALRVTLPAVKGTITVTGFATGLKFGHAMPAVKGTIALTSFTTGLRVGRKLTATPGAITLNGTTTALVYQRKMPAVKGSIVLGGVTTNLVYSGAGPKTMPAVTGSITLTSYPVTFRRIGVLKATTTAITLTGNATGLRLGRRLVATTSAITLTGYTTGLVFGHNMPAVKGTVTLTGNAAALRVGRNLPAVKGTITLTGSTAALRAALKLPVTPGAYTLTGYDVNLVRTLATRYVFPPFVVNENLFFPPTVVVLQQIFPELFLDPDRFFSPTISYTQFLAPGLFADPDVFPQAVVTVIYVDTEVVCVPFEDRHMNAGASHRTMVEPVAETIYVLLENRRMCLDANHYTMIAPMEGRDMDVLDVTRSMDVNSRKRAC